MERPHWFNEDLALFIADSADVRARLDMLNQKLLASLTTLSNPIPPEQSIELSDQSPVEQKFLEHSVDSDRLPSSGFQPLNAGSKEGSLPDQAH